MDIHVLQRQFSSSIKHQYVYTVQLLYEKNNSRPTQILKVQHSCLMKRIPLFSG